jgi:hypothetical protein
MKHLLVILAALLAACPLVMAEEDGLQKEPADKQLSYGVIDSQLLETAYSDGERMRYDVTWTGGVKIGELTLEIRRIKGQKTATHRVKAVISTENGAIHGIYPVRDVHVTTVLGKERLPSRYEVRQKEGYNYEAHRLTRYNQESGRIAYRKNDNPDEVVWVKTPIHNEFSAFLSSRVMPFAVGESFLVPTFADKKRNEVKVKVMAREALAETVLGKVETMKVMPVLEFQGLYDKNGDTVIWYTDDACRVPVLINSKLKIGSLTMSLVSYENENCPQYHGRSAIPSGLAGEKKTQPAATVTGNMAAGAAESPGGMENND